MADSTKILQSYLRLHHDATSQLHGKTANEFSRWVELAVETLRAGKKIMLFGNGGSAAEAQHIAAELSVKFFKDRKPLAAMALTTDSSVLTAGSNDYGFEHVIARQVAALGQEGDLAIGYSTSGTSANILAALAQARKQNIRTAGLTGGKGGKMPEHCDVCIVAPSDLTPHIQEMHTILGHAFCVAVEDALNLIPVGSTSWKI